MRGLTCLTLFTLLAALVSPTLQAPTVQVQQCLCPTADLAGHQLIMGKQTDTGTTATLYCFYQTSSNFCQYFVSNEGSKLTRDEDGGQCAVEANCPNP